MIGRRGFDMDDLVGSSRLRRGGYLQKEAEERRERFFTRVSTPLKRVVIDRTLIPAKHISPE